MKPIKAVLFSCVLLMSVALLGIHGADSYQKVNVLGCLECHDSSFSKGSIHFIHSSYCEACHSGEGLDLGIVYTVSCVSCHPSDEPGACSLVFLHEDFVECDTDSQCCADCHVECIGGTTTEPSTSTTTTAVIPTSSTTTISAYCVVETIYGESSEKTQFFRWVGEKILSRTPEGRKIMELYYTWSPVVVKMMEEDEDLKGKVHQILDEIVSLSEVGVE